LIHQLFGRDYFAYKVNLVPVRAGFMNNPENKYPVAGAAIINVTENRDCLGEATTVESLSCNVSLTFKK